MQFTRFVLALSLLSLAVLLPVHLAAQSPATVSAELTFRNRYHFAGIPFANEVTQAKVTVAIGSLTLNGFSTFDHDFDDLLEADIWGDYYVQLSPMLGMFVGGAVYVFKFRDPFVVGGKTRDGWEPTPEAYAGLVLSAPLSPTLYAAYDFEVGDGAHVALMLSQEVPLGPSGLTLGFKGNVDYNNSYWEEYYQFTGSDSGLAYADVGVSLGIPVGPVRIAPSLVIQRGIHDDFKNFDEEIFSVTASFTFGS